MSLWDLLAFYDYSPKIKFSEDGSSICYTFTLPGLGKDEIDLEHDEKYLYLVLKGKEIKGSYKYPIKEKYDTITAEAKHGILTITLNYTKPVRSKIDIT